MEIKRNLRVLYRRKLRDQGFLVRFGIIITFVAVMTIIIPRSVRHEYRFQEGDIWNRPDLKAKTSFVVKKDPDSLAAQRELVRASVPLVLEEDSLARQASYKSVRASIDRFVGQLRLIREAEGLTENAEDYAGAQNYFLNEIGINQERFPTGENWLRRMPGIALDLLTELNDKGYCRNSVPRNDEAEFVYINRGDGRHISLKRESILFGEPALESWMRTNLAGQNEAVIELLIRIFETSVSPNLTYREDLTEQARADSIRWIPSVRDWFEEGDVIIERNTAFTNAELDRLSAYYEALRETSGVEQSGGVLIGRFLVIFLITLLMLAFLRINRPKIYFSNQRLSLIMSTILLVVAAMVVATKLNEVALQFFERSDLNLSYIYLAPACIVPIFMNNFFDHRVAFFSNLVVAFTGAVLVQLGLEYAFVQLIAGAVAVYSLRKLRKREVFFYTLGFIFLGYTISYITFNLFSKGNLDAVNLNTLLLFGINVLLTIIAYNLIYLFEQIFKVTSDLTYLELLDTNHPLLKELAKKAPGTFQHSLQVANIAEAVVNEIGGNALLIHVGALYHDIGKMVNARYFIENQQHSGKKDTPHEKLSCRESAEMIINHVLRGVSIAQRYHLPRELVHFIETHHGTTRVEFFYRKHLKESGCKAPTDEEIFRYPGPLPFSKETAVLMMADSVEAASRSLKNPTIDSLESLVDKIIDSKIADNQLVNSPLTFRDISIIRDVLKKQLTTIYHGRIEYPRMQPEREPEEVR